MPNEGFARVLLFTSLFAAANASTFIIGGVFRFVDFKGTNVSFAKIVNHALFFMLFYGWISGVAIVCVAWAIWRLRELELADAIRIFWLSGILALVTGMVFAYYDNVIFSFAFTLVSFVIGCSTFPKKRTQKRLLTSIR